MLKSEDPTSGKIPTFFNPSLRVPKYQTNKGIG